MNCRVRVTPFLECQKWITIMLLDTLHILILGLFAKQPRAKYKSYKGEVGKTCNNKLLIKVIDKTNHKTIYKRDFSTTKLNEKWTTDVSEFYIAAGKLYLSPILDMHNREIVSFNISRSPNF